MEIQRELYIDTERFDECLDDFKQVVSEHQKANKPVAFKSGFINEQEGYKRRVFNEAKKLKPKKKGSFCKWVMYSTSIKDNNLIDWRDRDYLQVTFKEHSVESEDLLFRIYTGTEAEEEQLFKEAVMLWGRRYPIISYIFFLKDRTRFLPVRPNAFKKHFQFLNIDAAYPTECTWENYQVFLAVMEEVRGLLEQKNCFKENKVELIDAHSFVWMMWLLEKSEEHVDSVDRKTVIYDNEGRMLEYYGTRYERSRKNREAAIAVHGCRCMVCGFDFQEAYGELGKGFIEVHHVKPLYLQKGKVEKVNPRTDLVCLCSNCHRMIHRGSDKLMTVEELKALYTDNAGVET